MRGFSPHLAHDAVTEKLQGHVRDGAVSPRLNLGLNAQVPRQAKVRDLGPEAMRDAVAARQQHVTCTAHLPCDYLRRGQSPRQVDRVSVAVQRCNMTTAVFQVGGKSTRAASNGDHDMGV